MISRCVNCSLPLFSDCSPANIHLQIASAQETRKSIFHNICSLSLVLSLCPLRLPHISSPPPLPLNKFIEESPHSSPSPTDASSSVLISPSLQPPPSLFSLWTLDHSTTRLIKEAYQTCGGRRELSFLHGAGASPQAVRSMASMFKVTSPSRDGCRSSIHHFCLIDIRKKESRMDSLPLSHLGSPTLPKIIPLNQ
ncbi:unnamed protein product [Rangifer tarandus platyrhynchus]|uniref:Uncharacterized protein n=1 Tax=Rangifer tarandus platyrhynchus TaxID=3082113 RepID=A0ABN8Y5S0_RANTA|nr:unnamed protein product [Rangifer tarandus platyrhynchus]